MASAFARALNLADVKVAFGKSPQRVGVLVTADLADEQTPFFTNETFPVAPGPDFGERATAFVQARTKEVSDRHGIAEIHVQVSQAGQLRVVVFNDNRSDSATWFPFPSGPMTGSWS